MFTSLKSVFGCIFLLLLIGNGCSKSPPLPPQINTIKFLNNTPGEIWVDSVEGFQKEPPAGILTTGAGATSFMGPQRIPTKVTITWWKGDRQNRIGEIRKSEVAISAPTKLSAATELVFQFSEPDSWTSEFQ